MSKETKNRFTVLTPAGNIYVDSATEASEYKRLYGYPYHRNPLYVPDESEEEEED